MTDSRPNVLYITIDSVRADRIGHLGYSTETTPTIDRLAEEGTAFEHAVANGIPTYYSFKSLIGGSYPLSYGREIGLDEETPSIAEVFASTGYTTAGFIAGNPWLTRTFGYDRGFDVYRDFLTDEALAGSVSGDTFEGLKRKAKRAVSWSDWLTDKLGYAGRMASLANGRTPAEPAEVVTDSAIEWLSSMDEPFFLWVHYMDPHYPWLPTQRDLSTFTNDQPSWLEIGTIWHTVAHLYKKDDVNVDQRLLKRIKTMYDAELRRTDREIGRLVAALRDEGVWSDTNTVIVGDHGTELHDRGGFSHGPQRLYDEIVRVPLVFHGPDVPVERRRIAALVDVPATITAASGIEPPDSYVGMDVREHRRSAVTTEVVFDFDPIREQNEDNGVLRARTEWPWKLIHNDHTDSTELYNLAEDPRERSDRSNSHPDVVANLRDSMDEFRTARRQEVSTAAEKRRIRRKVKELQRSGLI